MKNKLLRANIYIFASTLLIPTYSFACETTEITTLEREKNGLLTLMNDKPEYANLYNFRSRRCVSLKQAHNELEISAFLPNDETSQGIYQLYRNKGENQIDALKHTLEFMIQEQQS